ncbi:MAG: ISAzo13 family transposase [Proteiniphilum sp.]
MAEKKTPENSEAADVLKSVIADYEAGLPTNSAVYWVNLSPSKICRKMQILGEDTSYYLVSNLLKELGYSKRRYSKEQCLGNPENRDAQFKKIARLKKAFCEAGLPVLSIDTKQKEMLGNFDRGESYYGKEKRKVLDHDFQSHASGIVIPHGIYDCFENKGYISLGTSKDTSEFVCDNLLYYWQTELQWVYPDAGSMLLLCDGGGSNACLHYIVKHDFCKLSKLLGMNILVAHYPAYCSKWNPIEHKLFSHLHRAWQGAIFHDIQIVKELASETSTATGLTVKVNINDKTYQTGRKVTDDFKENINKHIIFDDQIPKWNYLVTQN